MLGCPPAVTGQDRCCLFPESEHSSTICVPLEFPGRGFPWCSSTSAPGASGAQSYTGILGHTGLRLWNPRSICLGWLESTGSFGMPILFHHKANRHLLQKSSSDLYYLLSWPWLGHLWCDKLPWRLFPWALWCHKIFMMVKRWCLFPMYVLLYKPKIPCQVTSLCLFCL